MLSLAGNAYQFIRQQRVEHDLDLRERSSERQIADMKEALSGVLQQDLLRYDELNKQLQTVGASAVAQAKSAVKRDTSALAKTFERDQDVLTQLSDLKSDWRQDTASQLTQLSSAVQRTDSDLKRVVSELDTTNGKVEHNSEELEEHLAAAPAARPEHEQAGGAAAPRTKRFWSKLNPFSKKKSASADSSYAR
ncbi:MAG TPA: hypothetical protein VMH80_28680 [Bryobacteraceae bacterium]|nr:hypothetical protein [Bryobacteraceae bacterium]